MDAPTLAGFFAAHAVWCVSDGETLVPIYAYASSDRKPEMIRLAHDRLEDGVQEGRKRLETVEPGIAKVLIFDGRITLPQGKIDALIVEWRTQGKQIDPIVLAIPYRPKSDRATFAVHKPKVLALPDDLQDAMPGLLQSFFNGVDRHEQGSRVWNAHLDESL